MGQRLLKDYYVGVSITHGYIFPEDVPRVMLCIYQIEKIKIYDVN